MKLEKWPDRGKGYEWQRKMVSLIWGVSLWSSSPKCGDNRKSLNTFSICSYPLSHFISPLDSIQFQQRTDGCKLLLFGLHWCVHVYESTEEEYCLRFLPCVEIHKKTSLMNYFLFLQKHSTCLLRLTWMICEIGGKKPYCCFFWDTSSRIFFETVSSNVMYFSSSFLPVVSLDINSSAIP